MKKKNMFSWIIGILAIITVIVSAYFGFTQKGLNSGTSASGQIKMVSVKSKEEVI